MVITITEVTRDFTKNGAEYIKVKGISNDKEVTKSVFDNLQEKWELLKENATLEFVMEKKGQFWNVKDIKPIETPPAQGVKPQPTPDRIKPSYGRDENRTDWRNAIITVKDLWLGGKLDDTSSLVQAMMIGLQCSLHLELGEAVNETKTALKTQDNKEADNSQARLQTIREHREFANPGEFLTACTKEKNLKLATVFAELDVKDASELTDLTKAWQDICAIHPE